MDRYIVFAGANYYPLGGVDDIVLTTDDIGVALSVARDRVSSDCSGYWAQVYDHATKEKVFAKEEW